MISKVRLEILKNFGSQERFAVAAKMDEAVVSKLARGIRKPTEQQRQTFARLLEIPADELFGDQNGQAAR